MSISNSTLKSLSNNNDQYLPKLHFFKNSQDSSINALGNNSNNSVDQNQMQLESNTLKDTAQSQNNNSSNINNVDIFQQYHSPQENCSLFIQQSNNLQDSEGSLKASNNQVPEDKQYFIKQFLNCDNSNNSSLGNVVNIPNSSNNSIIANHAVVKKSVFHKQNKDVSLQIIQNTSNLTQSQAFMASASQSKNLTQEMHTIVDEIKQLKQQQQQLQQQPQLTNQKSNSVCASGGDSVNCNGDNNNIIISNTQQLSSFEHLFKEPQICKTQFCFINKSNSPETGENKAFKKLKTENSSISNNQIKGFQLESKTYDSNSMIYYSNHSNQQSVNQNFNQNNVIKGFQLEQQKPFDSNITMNITCQPSVNFKNQQNDIVTYESQLYSNNNQSSIIMIGDDENSKKDNNFVCDINNRNQLNDNAAIVVDSDWSNPHSKSLNSITEKKDKHGKKKKKSNSSRGSQQQQLQSHVKAKRKESNQDDQLSEDLTNSNMEYYISNAAQIPNLQQKPPHHEINSKQMNKIDKYDQTAFNQFKTDLINILKPKINVNMLSNIGDDCVLWIARLFEYNFERALQEIKLKPKPFILLTIGFYL